MRAADTLLAEIEAFVARHSMKESMFGRHTVNDGKFVRRLRSGSRITTDTMEKVRAFMRERNAVTRPRAKRKAN